VRELGLAHYTNPTIAMNPILCLHTYLVSDQSLFFKQSKQVYADAKDAT
jgi:hypothetical protein